MAGPDLTDAIMGTARMKRTDLGRATLRNVDLRRTAGGDQSRRADLAEIALDLRCCAARSSMAPRWSRRGCSAPS